MKFKLVPRLKPDIGFREIFAAFNFFGSGKIEKFENEFAKKFKNEYGVMFSHGRVGLYSLFKIWELENAEIICPAYTCVVVSHAIVLSGNIPVFVDCAEGSPNMDYAGIENAITENTRCIIVTHLFGYPMDVNKIYNIVKIAEKKYGEKIYVVQDVAHSFGCSWEGVLVTQFGDASIFGLNISKTITSIFGGMVTTNSIGIKEKLNSYRKNSFIQKGFSKNLKRALYLLAVCIAFHPYVYALTNFMERKKMLDQFVKYYDDDKIKFPSDWKEQPCETEAAVGLIQLKKYDKIISLRIFKARQWIITFKNDKSIRFFPEIEGATYSHCVALVENREKWVQNYYDKGYQLGILIEYNIPEIVAYKKFYRNCVIAQSYSTRTINFPINDFKHKIHFSLI
jgi:perosamine synthetase